MNLHRTGPPTVVVGAAVIRDGRVLAAQRSRPPELAGRWEFPGGKVEAGEDDRSALDRECREELGVAVQVGARVGPEVPTVGGDAVLRVYVAVLVDGEPQPVEHSALRWLAADELDTVDWLAPDRPVVEAVRIALRQPGQ